MSNYKIQWFHFEISFQIYYFNQQNFNSLMFNFICLPLLISLIQVTAFFHYIIKYSFKILEICLEHLSRPKSPMNPKRTHAEIGLSQANRIDRTEILSIQKICKLIYDQAKNENNLKTYKKIKYSGVIYKIGEFVELYHLGANNHYVAKLVSIGSIIDLNKTEKLSHKIDLQCPMIEVEWYMRKADLSKDPKFQKQYKNLISESEVFASGKTFALPVEAIVSKCEILTFGEYWNLQIVESSIYFSRASYNSDTETLTPSIEEWEPKFCVCEKPYNPDLEWVQCDVCKKWFHGECVFRDLSKSDDFSCSNCTRKDVEKKKKKKK